MQLNTLKSIRQNYAQQHRSKARMRFINALRTLSVTSQNRSIETIQNIENLKLLLGCCDINNIKRAITWVSNIMSSGNVDKILIDTVLTNECILNILQCSHKVQDQVLQEQSTWVLLNLVSGTSQDTEKVVEHGAITHFIRLVESSNPRVIQYSIWALGNIASDNKKYRDQILEKCFLEKLIQMIGNTQIESIVLKAVWAITIICQQALEQKIRFVLPTLVNIIISPVLDSYQLISDCCWTLLYLNERNSNSCVALMNQQLINKLIIYLHSPLASLTLPCLRIIHNLSIYEFRLVNHYKIMSILTKLMQDQEYLIREESYQFLLRISADRENVKLIYQNKVLMRRLEELLEVDHQNEILQLVCLILSNLGIRLFHSISESIFSKMYRLVISSQNHELAQIALKSCENILNTHPQLYYIIQLQNSNK